MLVNVERITYPELGEALHVALRKTCESKATSAAWNIIYDQATDWAPYVKGLAEKLKPGMTTAEVTKAVKEFSTNEWAMWDKGSHLLTALRCIFELFDDDDWDGYVAYLVDEDD